MDKLSAEQAIVAARGFLMQPGRLSGWFRPSSTDIILKGLNPVEEIKIKGCFPIVYGDVSTLLHVEVERISAWNVTLKVRRFTGKATIQIFSAPGSENPIANVLEDTIDPIFLYTTEP